MSRSSGKTPKPELRLNLTRGGPSRIGAGGDQAQSPKRSSTSSSSPSSCVSSENEQKAAAQNSPEAKSMVLAGCPRCLIYVMLSDEDPKCPRCKSTVLLDFHHGNSSGKGC